MLETEDKQVEFTIRLLDRIVARRAEELSIERKTAEAIAQVYGVRHVEERMQAEKEFEARSAVRKDARERMADLLLRIQYGESYLVKSDVRNFDELIEFVVDDFAKQRAEQMAKVEVLKLVNSEKNFSEAQPSDNIYLQTRQELGKEEKYFAEGVAWLSSLKLMLEKAPI